MENATTENVTLFDQCQKIVCEEDEQTKLFVEGWNSSVESGYPGNRQVNITSTINCYKSVKAMIDQTIIAVLVLTLIALVLCIVGFFLIGHMGNFDTSSLSGVVCHLALILNPVVCVFLLALIVLKYKEVSQLKPLKKHMIYRMIIFVETHRTFRQNTPQMLER